MRGTSCAHTYFGISWGVGVEAGQDGSGLPPKAAFVLVFVYLLAVR